MKVFILLGLFLCALGSTPAWSQSIQNPVVEQALAAAQKTKPILFCDLDNTLGIQDETTGKWTLYDGVIDFLKKQKQTQHVFILTANTRKNTEALFEQYPELKDLIEMTITAEDYCPLFAKAIESFAEEFKTISRPTDAQWRQSLYEAWSKNPAGYLPAGVKIDPMPTTVDDWRTRVYLPYLAPDKTGIVIRFNAILIDDRFVKLPPGNKYEILAQTHRGIFSGNAGGFTADSGPDFLAIDQKIENARSFLEKVSKCDLHAI